MKKWIWLFCFQFLLPEVMSQCPSECSCTDTVVDCSGQQLKSDTLPNQFPSSTREIRLNNNQLTTLPNGFFDKLPMLQKVVLNGNPWKCDCDLLYFRSWLQKQQNRAFYKDVVCTYPQGLKGRLVMYLTEDELLSSCEHGYCSLAFIAQIVLFIFIILHVILLIVLIVFLKRFEKFSREANMVRNEGCRGADMAPEEHDYLLYNHSTA
ncbi:platelet glycoprotein Ib beta chain [Protopterus annectens]|uniref:platelet glycoprotein Ib beta chain n=1 Tax=Protopterus annectens TaxID=7888 RepID=UPI001CF9977E|nr:platelet glycoprotein Ib beta chain [Protopterus annectens]